jgi:hypothetical protein
VKQLTTKFVATLAALFGSAWIVLLSLTLRQPTMLAFALWRVAAWVLTLGMLGWLGCRLRGEE